MKNKLVELVARREIAEGRRLTIAEISRDSGIPRPTIHHWLKTPYLSKFDSATINNFCDYFGCEIGDLLEREPEAAG